MELKKKKNNFDIFQPFLQKKICNYFCSSQEATENLTVYKSSLQGSFCHPHFTEEETESRKYKPHPRIQRWSSNTGWELRLPGTKTGDLARSWVLTKGFSTPIKWLWGTAQTKKVTKDSKRMNVTVSLCSSPFKAKTYLL